MKITNKIFIILIQFALITAAIGFIMHKITPANGLGETLLSSGFNIGHLLALLLLMRNGTIYKTIYWRIIQFSFVLTVLGAMFKVMHWPFAGPMLFISFLSIVLTYAVRFINKKEKRRLDILKFIWVLSYYTGATLIIQHWGPYEVAYFSLGILWLMVIDFVISGIKSKTLFLK